MALGIVFLYIGVLIVVVGLLMALLKSSSDFSEEDLKLLLWNELDNPDIPTHQKLDEVYHVILDLQLAGAQRKSNLLLLLMVGNVIALIGFVLLLFNGYTAITCVLR